MSLPGVQRPPPWPQGLVARRAAVRPRVRTAARADPLRLEDQVAGLLEQRTRGIVNVFGDAGSGKTVALEHLASYFGPRADLFFADNRYPQWVDVAAREGLVVFTSRERREGSTLAFEMAPWGRDEIIEYLLAAHREACGSVMGRLLEGQGQGEISGLPELWKPLLDLMASDSSVPSARDALRRWVDACTPNAGARMVLASFCLGLLTDADREVNVDHLINDAPNALRLARCRPVQLLFAAEGIVGALELERTSDCLREPLDGDVIRETASLLQRHPRALRRLQEVLRGHDRALHPTAAGLVLAADRLWRPREDGIPNLTGAKLRGANWKGIRLWGVDLDGTDLSVAHLSDAHLPDASLARTNLAGALLMRAWLDGARATDANLDGADMSGVSALGTDFGGANLTRARLERAKLKQALLVGANLTEARLRGTDLKDARLSDATITKADFSNCRLDGAWLAGLCLREACFRGATFRGAELCGCDMQGMDLAKADFHAGTLSGADLTGASLAGADFRKADLRSAGLAETNLERADLRKADLRGATFHMGTTRSGRVGSDVPCEGSRTGFYTDDSCDQDYKEPEEIRKANLRGADLMGARVEGTDFYLVDLRDATYSKEQRKHFRRCRAIL